VTTNTSAYSDYLRILIESDITDMLLLSTINPKPDINPNCNFSQFSTNNPRTS